MYDLRGHNNRVGSKAQAYRISPISMVALLDEYDIYSALVLGYEIVIYDLMEGN